MTGGTGTTTAPHVLIAMDKFKGSLSAYEVSDCLRRGIRSVRPDVPVVVVPMADGGEGTLDIALGNGYRPRTAEVHGPDGRVRTAVFATCGPRAVLESASASGLHHLGPRLMPLTATSRGLGDLLLAALDSGSTDILVGLGGSASTDGGSGMLSALGARLLDSRGAPLADGGDELSRLEHVDLSSVDPRLAATTLTVACDVDNPLLGARGASAVFGPQKGATPDDVRRLEAGLARLDEVLRSTAGVEPDAEHPGAGAAGGLGYALMSVLGARRRRGVEAMIELARLEDHLSAASLVVVGEGSLDEQSLEGKAPIGIARLAASRGVPVVAVCGRTTLDEAQLAAAGLTAHYPMSDLEPDLHRSLANASALAERIGVLVGQHCVA